MKIFNRKRKKPHNSGIVLAGGASRGAYQIGAWSVLRSHGFEFDGFAGTSVGALNAALMAQDDFDFAQDLWNNISLKDVLILPPELKDVNIAKLSFKDMLALYQEIWKSGGLDSTPLLKMLREYSREDALRKSGVDLGLVTFGIPQLKPLRIFLDEMEPGKLAQYLYASASFPLFKMAKIEDKKFTDGGVYDNLPAQMLQGRGYRDLVLIDISAYGMVRKPEWENHRILYIKNSRPLPNVMDFSRKSIQASWTMGELDTRRILGELDGIGYYINRFRDKGRMLDRLNGTFDDFDPQRLPEELRSYRPRGIAILEAASMAYGIEPAVSYSIDELMSALKNRERLIQAQVRQTALDEEPVNLGTITEVLHLILKEKMGDKAVLGKYPPMLWLHAADRLLPRHWERIRSMLHMLYPELDAAWSFRNNFLIGKTEK